MRMKMARSATRRAIPLIGNIPLNPLAAGELRAWKKICPRDAETGELRFVFPNGNGIVENHANISNRG